MTDFISNPRGEWEMSDSSGKLILYHTGDQVYKDGWLYVALRNTMGFDPSQGERAGWKRLHENRINQFTIGDTAPDGANSGDEWLDVTNGVLYKYVADEDSEQWISLPAFVGSDGATGPAGATGPTGPAGPTGDTGVAGSTTEFCANVGFADGNDTTGSLGLTADEWAVIPNDGAGAYTNTAYQPTSVSTLWDFTEGKIDPTGLTLGDALWVRNDFTIIPKINGSYITFRYTLGTGGNAYTLEKQLGSLTNGAGISYRFQFTDYIYMGDTNTNENLIGMEIKSSEDGEITNAGSVVQVLRRSV